MKRISALWQSFYDWLPTQIDRRVRVVAWLSLIFQVVLIGTGGTVRLTGSGLGCPTWPRCTADSLVNVPEQGIHGFIEFGNRLLTIVLGIIAVLAVLAVLKLRKENKGLLGLTVWILLGIPAQAVVGGIIVLSDLNPYLVGFHFVVSIILVALATIFVYRVYRPRPNESPRVPGLLSVVAWIAMGLVAVTVLVGILTTGSGPHAGDEKARRTGLDTEIMEHVHSYPAYALLAVTVLLLIIVLRSEWNELRGFVLTLLAIELVQAAVGLIQARTGLPIVLVNIHMVLAGLLTAAMTVVLLAMKQQLASSGRAKTEAADRHPRRQKAMSDS